MKKFFPAFLALVLFPLPAAAGNFCLAGFSLTPQCLYDDIPTCQRAADPPSTSCIVGAEAYLNFSGGARYCVVDETLMAQCHYVDRSQCNAEANRSRALCVDREERNSESDPYRYDPRLQR